MLISKDIRRLKNKGSGSWKVYLNGGRAGKAKQNAKTESIGDGWCGRKGEREK